MSIIKTFTGAVVAALMVTGVPAADAAEQRASDNSSSWAGFYIGAHAGYAWGERDGCFDILDINNACDGIIPPIPFDYDQDGGLIGAQLGYNIVYQNFVFGLEVEASLSDIEGDLDIFGGGPEGKGTYTRMAAAKARFGWAQDFWMVYLTAGLSIAEFEFEGPFGCNFDQTRHGYLVGAGTEVKITERASLKLEYNYRDFGKEDGRCQLFGLIPTYHEADADMHVLTFGFNYQLGDL